jgi:hypothetical protein
MGHVARLASSAGQRVIFFYRQRFGHPGPKFGEYKPIGAHTEIRVGLGPIQRCTFVPCGGIPRR